MIHRLDVTVKKRGAIVAMEQNCFWGLDCQDGDLNEENKTDAYNNEYRDRQQKDDR